MHIHARVLCLILFISFPAALAQEVAAIHEDTTSAEPSARVAPDENPSQDVGSVKIRRSYVIPAFEIVGFNFALNRFDKRFLPDPETFDVNRSTIRRNLKTKWVVDADPFAVNQFLHPYHGSIYHTTARSTGLRYWEAAIYTVLGSALWEVAGETEPPSINDQVASGVGGSFFGEALFRMANLTLGKQKHPAVLADSLCDRNLSDDEL
jgi:hypothetical protein